MLKIEHNTPYAEKEILSEKPVLTFDNVSIAYNMSKYAVRNITADLKRGVITAIMGPSGCGKSTLLRAVNRMHELYTGITVDGHILIEGQDIMEMDAVDVRRKAGMVFQHPNPFPSMSIYENVLAGYKLNGIRLSKADKDQVVETSLRNAGLWDEVKDSLLKRGTFLSGGQQQRLCIARTLALKPDLLLMDEPTSALDPIATHHIEELLSELKNEVSIVLVTHNLAQAARISDYTMFLYLGEMVEYDKTAKMFTAPNDPRTEQYLTGKIG